MKLRSYDGSLTCALVASVIVVAIFFAALALALSAAFGADTDQPCLSKAQARAKFPSQIIYWHGINHCWDNIPVRGKSSKLPSQDGNGNGIRKAPSAARPTVFYPSLMSGGGTDNSMLRNETMQTWPLIADFDADPPLFLPWQRMSGLLNR